MEFVGLLGLAIAVEGSGLIGLRVYALEPMAYRVMGLRV